AVTNLELVRQIAERIQANLPNVKLVVIIRNQEDMLISRYLQYVLQGGTFTPEAFYAALGENDFRAYADYRYGKVIEVLWDVFGRDRVLVLMQEELKQGADQLLQRLGDFMGHRFTQPEASGRKKNVGASYKGVRWIRTVNRWWVREVETTHAPTQTKVPHALWWGLTVALRKLDNWLVRQKEKARLMSPADRQRLRAAFAEDNRHLEQLLGRPVKPLGYHYD
ncbi:MAG: sulfotransferase domain-containing protein, partial [Bacteroidota bacterium]